MNGVYNSAVRTEKSDEVVDEPLLKEKLMERIPASSKPGPAAGHMENYKTTFSGHNSNQP